MVLSAVKVLAHAKEVVIATAHVPAPRQRTTVSAASPVCAKRENVGLTANVKLAAIAKDALAKTNDFT